MSELRALSRTRSRRNRIGEIIRNEPGVTRLFSYPYCPGMHPDDSKIAFVFPGQGSQSVGMGKELAEKFPLAHETFEEADDILDLNLSRIAWEGPAEELNDTINTQPALFVHSIATLRVLENTRPDLSPTYVAGHSMGELSSLVASRCLGFPDGLRLVRTRGELMKQAGDLYPGSMAAVLGLDIPEIEKICAQSSTPDEPVQIANDNCPGQVVISGATPALERAIDKARKAGAKRVVPLVVSIAAHSPLMEHAQNHFTQAINNSPIVAPKIPIIGNVSARPLTTVSEIRLDLQAQLNSRVRWTETIQFLAGEGITAILELGNGNVLTGLLKRIAKDLTGISIGTPADLLSLNQN
jgi:[acyl-carrier-protein] S-malonyltransferase